MGGSGVLRHAALYGRGAHGERTGAHTDTVVSISAPARRCYRGAAPTPLLLVHGDRDPYFPLDHPRMLLAAAGHVPADRGDAAHP